MSVIADLIRAGVDPDLVAQVAAEMVEAARSAGSARTARQERNARYYANKASEKRLTASNSDELDDGKTQGSPQVSPDGFPQRDIIKPLSLTPSSPSPIPSSAGAERGLSLEFEHEFWPLYPNKVGKPVARQSWVKARRTADLETILSGLRAYLAKIDDRPWCNPATWLNQERWNDAPAAAPRAGPVIPPQNNRNVYLGVDKQKQLIDEIFDRREAEYGQATIAGLLER
jgi:hypothetical protein